MFKKITSALLASSFFIVAISGVIMLFDKRLASTLRLDPFHELFALIMVISGFFHFILNFKIFVSYFKSNPVKILFSSIIGLTILLYVIIMNIDMPDKGRHSPDHYNKIETQNH